MKLSVPGVILTGVAVALASLLAPASSLPGGGQGLGEVALTSPVFILSPGLLP